MAGTHPRIVGDVGVARLHRRNRKVADEVLHRFRHRVDVAGRAGDGLRQHAAPAVEDAGGEVAALAHDRREGRADQHLRLLLDHGDQPVPHDLPIDQPDIVAAHGQAPQTVAKTAEPRLPSPRAPLRVEGG
jgi:hypothetical protein